MMGMTVVYDGRTVWLHMPTANRYSKFPLGGASQAATMGGGLFGSANAPLEYKSVTTGVKEAKIVRGEKIHVNDADVDCWVVSLEYEAAGGEANAPAQAAGVPFSDLARNRTLWVDKSRFLVYEDDSNAKMIMRNTNTPATMKQTSKVESVSVNDPVSPDVFYLHPTSRRQRNDESKFRVKTPEGPQSQN